MSQDNVAFCSAGFGVLLLISSMCAVIAAAGWRKIGLWLFVGLLASWGVAAACLVMADQMANDYIASAHPNPHQDLTPLGIMENGVVVAGVAFLVILLGTTGGAVRAKRMSSERLKPSLLILFLAVVVGLLGGLSIWNALLLLRFVPP